MPRKASTISDPYAHMVDEDHDMTIEEMRAEAVSGVFQVAQYVCLGFANFRDAGAIGRHAPNITKETVALAGKNKQVASKIDLLIQVGPYTGLIAAGLPFVMQILVNHGVLAAEKLANAGVVTPESLEYEMKTALMKQQMEAMREQQRIEDELRQMQEEMAEKVSANGSDPEANDE